MLSISDRIVFHDQLVPSRDRDAVLGDEEARDGAHAPGAGPLPVHQHTGLLHQQLRAHLLLLRDCQVSRMTRNHHRQTTLVTVYPPLFGNTSSLLSDRASWGQE